MTRHAPPERRPARLDRLDFHTCPTCGKRAYHSRDAAKAARKAIGDRTLHVYYCSDAGGFHLGHSASTREAARRRRRRAQEQAS